MYIKFKIKNVFVSALITGKVEDSEKITYFLHTVLFSVDGEDLITKSINVICTFDDEFYVLNYKAAHIDYEATYSLEEYRIDALP